MTWHPLTPSIPNTLQSATNNAALQAGLVACSTLLLHPFQQTVGDGESHYKTLSFPNALDKLATKLGDNTDPHLTNNALLAIAVHDSTLAGFAAKLKPVALELGINDFMVPQQRAELLATLENDKWTINTASPVQVPVSDKIAANICTLTDDFTRARARQISHDESQATIGDAKAELAALQQLKTAHDQSVASAMDDVELPAVDASVLYLSGDLVSGVKNSGGPGHDQTLTAIFVVLGSSEQLKVWREVCGV